jgi:predicted nucleic acid-binding protein
MVPCHWILEVTNTLLRARRHGRLRPREHPADILERLGELPIVADVETSIRAWRETFALAETCRLTIYDAAYLELALRLAAPLVTLDMDLARAANAAGADVMAPD